MSRPTISLSMIVKNEAENLPRLFDSIKGCFDEVIIVDTGSTDNTIEIAKANGATVHHFTWLHDFSKARNFSFSKATCDYVMWLDGDDALSSAEEFIRWRDNVMVTADFWIAPYWYAFDSEGKPVCTFSRERVVKREKAVKWRYPIHEGMIPEKNTELKANHVSGWHVNHMRTMQDYESDKGRNLKILTDLYESLTISPRLMFYYGKELFDAGQIEQSIKIFDELARDMDKLEHHDKVLTYEYWVRALTVLHRTKEAEKTLKDNNLIEKAYALAVQGTILAPTRAELYVTAGDCLLQLGRLRDALPYYSAASACYLPGPTEPTAIFSNKAAYTSLPLDQMARVYANLGSFDKAIEIAKINLEKYGSPQTQELLDHMVNLVEQNKTVPNLNKVKTDEIVISCFEQCCPYEWNDEIYATKGIGGSETAAVEIAEQLAIKTKRPVIVFNKQSRDRVSPNGVLYTSASQMQDYFSKNEPSLHIAWRHSVRLTDAPSFLWCHDLVTPGAENIGNYDKIICLSEFHKNYVMLMQGIPEHKIVVSKNGIDESRFDAVDTIGKRANKIIFPSSPDRELKRVIDIVSIARELRPDLDLELNVYYGFDNLYKYGLGKLADELKDIISKNTWIKYHGNIPQKQLANEMIEAAVWLYAPNFIETFCITAIECLKAKCYPIARSIGALKDTLGWANKTGNAKLMNVDVDTREHKTIWAKELINAIDEKRWDKMDVSSQDLSWSSVADHFISFMNIKPAQKTTEVEVADAILPEVVEVSREYGQATI